MSKPVTIRSLTEDLEHIGLKGGIDMSLLGISESKSDDEDEDEDGSEAEESIKAVAEHAYTEARGALRESDIDYDVAKFESDLKGSIEKLTRKLYTEGMSADVLRDAVLDKLVESMQISFDKKLEEKIGKPHDKLTEADLSEKAIAGSSRVIMARKGGRLVRKRQKLAARSERIARGRKNRKKKGHLKLARKKWMRTAGAKKSMKLRKKAEARTPTNPKLESEGLSRVERMRALLTENTEASVPLTQSAMICESLEEAFDRIIRIGDLLATFFEDHGVADDLVIAESLTEMIGIVGPARDALTESGDAATIESRLKSLQRYTAVLSEALDEFSRYRIEASDDEDEDEEYDDEDEWDDEDEDEDEDEE